MDTAAVATLSRADTAAAYERHRLAQAETGAAWDSLADLFAPEATYFDAFYGEFRGREAIRNFLRDAMRGLEDWRFPVVWHEVGEGRVVVHLMNRLPGRRPDGTYFEFPSVSLITYGPDGAIVRQMDLYDSLAAIRVLIEAKSGLLGRVATGLWAWTRSTVPELLRAVNGRPGQSR